MRVIGITLLVVALSLGVVVVSCAKAPAALPSRSQERAEVKGELRWTGIYAKDIQPVFDAYCVSCHGPNYAANGLKLNSYEGVMAGTRYGRVVFPGKAAGSTLLLVLEREAPAQIHMPWSDMGLSASQIKNISLWVEAGAAED